MPNDHKDDYIHTVADSNDTIDANSQKKVMLAVDALIATMGGTGTQITINRWPACAANDPAFQKEVADYVLAKTGKPLINNAPAPDTLDATATAGGPKIVTASKDLKVSIGSGTSTSTSTSTSTVPEDTSPRDNRKRSASSP